MAINGNNIIVYLGGVAIAGASSCELDTKIETIETSSPTTGQWREHKKGRKTWNVSVSYLVGAETGVEDLLAVGTTYTLLIKGRGQDSGLTGSATMTACRITATRGSLVQGSFVFQGDGELSGGGTSSSAL